MCDLNNLINLQNLIFKSLTLCLKFQTSLLNLHGAMESEKNDILINIILKALDKIY